MLHILQQVRACRLCETELPIRPRPLFMASESARVLIIGQAPGRAAHERGVPWNAGATGCEIGSVNPKSIAIMPMGFCHPGTGKSGDLPHRTEWRAATAACCRTPSRYRTHRPPNGIWMSKNQWFTDETLPLPRQAVEVALGCTA